MKKQSIILLATAMFSATLFSCASDDSAVADNGNNGGADNGDKIVLGATLPSATNTRVALNDPDNGTGIKATWELSGPDKITVIDKDAGNAAANLTLTKVDKNDDGVEGVIGRFEGHLETVKHGHQLYAYFPTVSTTGSIIKLTAANSNTVDVDYSAQEGTLAWCQKNALLFGAAKYFYNSFTDWSNFEMNQMCSMLRIKLNLGTVAKTINKIQIYGAELTNKGSFDPTTTDKWTSLAAGAITITPTSSLSVSTNTIVYALLPPQTLASGYYIVATATDGTTFTYKHDGKAIFEIGKVHTINSGFVEAWTESKHYTKSEYYQWDAYASYVSGKNPVAGTASWEEGSEGFNPVRISDDSDDQIKQNLATVSAQSCPTAYEIKMYIGAGGQDIYMDKGEEGLNQQTYSCPDGKTYHSGLWLVKKQYIDGFAGQTGAAKDNATWDKEAISGRPSPDIIYKYFFLPAAGVYYTNSIHQQGGQQGYYWSSTPGYNSKNPNATLPGFSLYFNFNSSNSKTYNHVRFGSNDYWLEKHCGIPYWTAR